MKMLKDVIELAQKDHTKVSHRNKLRKLSLLLLMQMLKNVIELAQKYHTKVSHRNKLRKLSLLLADANVEKLNRARAKIPL